MSCSISKCPCLKTEQHGEFEEAQRTDEEWLVVVSVLTSSHNNSLKRFSGTNPLLAPCLAMLEMFLYQEGEDITVKLPSSGADMCE